MQDLGHKSEAPTETAKQEIYYPSMTFTTEEIPALEGKKVGDKVKLFMIGEIKGLRENDEEMSYDIEFHKCELSGKVSEEEYKDMSDEEKDKADEEEILSEE